MNISISSPVVIQPPTAESGSEKKDLVTTGAVTDVEPNKSVQDAKALGRTQVLPNANYELQQVKDKSLESDEGKSLESAVVELNKAVQNVQRNLEFSVDDITGSTIVQVKDRETNELIRQMPSEDALKLAQSLHEQLSDGSSDLSIMQALKA